MNKFLITVVVMIVGLLMFFTFSKPKRVVAAHGPRSTTKLIVEKSVTPPKAKIVAEKERVKEGQDDFGKKVYSQKGKAAYEYTPPKIIPKAKIVKEKKPLPTNQSKPKILKPK